jgi:uroporphyrinogen decarboxylase
MTKRDVIRTVLEGGKSPYVPWSCGFTVEAKKKLIDYFKGSDIEEHLQNHILILGNAIGFFKDLGNNLVQDVFGVVWDRSIDKDIGNVKGCVLPEPTLKDYKFPDPHDPRIFKDIPERISRYGDRFRVFAVGFSLYERAWTLRGMENLLMDMVLNPGFVHELLNSIVDYNIAQIGEALKYEIDAVYFGDDWGQQYGLQMGIRHWHEFIYPALKRMYSVVKDAGKYVMIHSCGDVDELFEDLIAIGLSCFNPFQPEVMDVFSLMKRYRGRLTFFGGLSTQRTLPYGGVQDVREETKKLLEAGKYGGYIFAPAHDVEGDVPLENMLAFMDVIQSQPGYGG